MPVVELDEVAVVAEDEAAAVGRVAVAGGDGFADAVVGLLAEGAGAAGAVGAGAR